MWRLVISGEGKESIHRVYHRKEEIGDDNTVEVIQAEIKPLSSLISESSQNLKAVMENLLESYGEMMQGGSIIPKQNR